MNIKRKRMSLHKKYLTNNGGSIVHLSHPLSDVTLCGLPLEGSREYDGNEATPSIVVNEPFYYSNDDYIVSCSDCIIVIEHCQYVEYAK